METGSLVRVTTLDGTSMIDGRYNLSPLPETSDIIHLFDPSKPTEIVEGMKALALYPEDSEYYPGTVSSPKDGTFKFLFDDGDVLESVTPSTLKLLPLPELLVDKDAVKVGMVGQCYFASENEFYEGTVGADNGDGTYRFDFDDGDVAPKVYLHDMSHLVEKVTEKILEAADKAANDDAEDAGLDEFLNDDDNENPYGDDFDISDDGIDIGEPTPTASSPPATSPSSTAPSAISPTKASASTPPKVLAQSNSDLNILLTESTGVPAPDSTSPSKPETSIPSPPPSLSRPPEQSYLASQSHLHPLLVPPNPLSPDTGPAERLQTLAIEYVDLEDSYLNTLNTSINHRNEREGGKEEVQAPPFIPSEEGSQQAAAASKAQAPLLVNSMTALKMRSKALSILVYGETCLETVQESIDLATCYSHNQLWVQASLHAKSSLAILEKDLADAQTDVPNVLAKNSAAALLHLFESIRSILSKCNSDSVPLKDLVALLEGPVYMENIVSDVNDIYSSSTGVEQHGFPTLKLISALRKMDGFRLCVRALEGSLRPYQLSLLKKVVAKVEGFNPEGLSAPDAAELVKGFRSTTASYALVEGSDVITKLGQIILTNGDDAGGENDKGGGSKKLTRVFYEEVLSMLSISLAVTSRETWASHLKVQALTLIGRSLFSLNKFSGALEKFATAKKLVDESGREDFLSSSSVLSGYSDALAAQATKKLGGKKKKKGGRGKLKEAMDFEAPAGKDSVKDNGAVNDSSPMDNLALADELLTHNYDIIESCFGTNNVITARSCCDVAFLAVVREKYDEGLEFLHKAFEIFRKVEAVVEGHGIGIGAASTSISIGRLKMRVSEDDVESGLSEIKYGAEYYRDVGDPKGFELFNELASIYEKNAGCIDYDAVECLENAVVCSVNTYGKKSHVTFSALKKLGDKSEEGGDFERAIAAYKKAFRCGEIVFGSEDARTKRVLKLIRKLKGGEEKKEEVGEDGHKGSAFFHEEKKAAKEFLAKEEERLKKEGERKRRKVKRRKKRKVMKKKVVEKKSVGEEVLGVVDGNREEAEKVEAAGEATVPGVQAVEVDMKTKKKKKVRQVKRKGKGAKKKTEQEDGTIEGKAKAELERVKKVTEERKKKGKGMAEKESVTEKSSITDALKLEEAERGGEKVGWKVEEGA